MNLAQPRRFLPVLALASLLTGMPAELRAQSEPAAIITEPIHVIPRGSSEPAPPAPTSSAGDGRKEPGERDPVDGEPIDRGTGVASRLSGIASAAGAPASTAPAAAPPAVVAPQSSPTGVDQTGVSSQSISLPQGAGKITGMGESFSNQLSTGTASYTVPIALPGARGGADPQLSLAYSTSGGHGLAGLGWDIGVPYIARQTDRGIPTYQDPNGAWAPTQDRFVFNGGQELVPICLVSGTTCSGGTAQPGEVMPAWANGWQYFRPRVEGSFLRVFWAPSHQTWRVQDKNGVSMELGVPLDGSSSTGTIETDPSNQNHIFRWNISRQYDAYGAANVATGAPLPVNVVRYAYLVDDGTSYLTDIYDTPPAAGAATASVTQFAHHVHLLYDQRSDITQSYKRGWLTEEEFRITGIDVTSMPFTGGSTRKLVRRYHLAYDPSYHVSLLTSVQVEGRCGTPAQGEAGEPIAEDGDGLLPSSSGCPMLPAMTFSYTHVTPYTSSGAPGVADLAGYEGFDERITTMAASPPHSVDESDTDLFDINADGLPDVLVTMPGLYNGNHGLYLNGNGGTNTFTATTMSVFGVLGEDTTTITLDNPNISSGDLDGDGLIDLIHMPQVKTYSVYTPQGSGTTWAWEGRAITTASAQSPKINLGSDGLNVTRMDVNNDGLVDVVISEGTEIDVFFSLDRYPGGDGQFGSATWTSGTTALISNDPVATCVPWDGIPVQFGDSTVKIADMNGDGFPDIVRVEQENVHYWPGRGDGHWGTMNASACPAGTFGENASIAMEAPPFFADPNAPTLRLDDVNGDGLDDMVVVNFTTAEVYLNVDGVGWTAAHLIASTPASPSYETRVRIVDMNGSGTRDILWGDAGAYAYMDLSGGARPWMLTHIQNGLGKTTDIGYAASTTLMLTAASAGNPWTSVTPSPVEVVTQMTVSDNLTVAGNPPGQYVTQYSYANPVYDGRQREFRGFTTASETRIGDANSPTSISQSTFLLGQCADDEPLNGFPSACIPAGRWRDNTQEGLKGLPTTVQSLDATGIYQSTTHHSYTLRLLYTGVDAREVRHAFESATDTFLYDGVSSGAATTLEMTDASSDLTPAAYSTTEDANPLLAAPVSPCVASATVLCSSVALQGATGQAHLQTQSDVDVFGNTYHAIDHGCASCTVPAPLAADETITKYSQPTEVSGNTGWLWRPTATFTEGSSAATHLDAMTQTFNVEGSPLKTSRTLSGTLALVRTNASGGGTAPAPTSASADGTAVVLTVTYDGFGNPISSVAANDRCRATGYDTVYSELPVLDTVDVGAVSSTCGATALQTQAAYDRGLGTVLTLTGFNGETTNVQFDGFGRIVGVFKPNPSTGVAATLASMTVAYQLPTNPTSTPYSLVQTQMQDGSDPTVASYRTAWAYVDGLGRTVVTLNQADPTNGDPAPWVASGLSTFDAKGTLKQKYLEYFYSGDPAQFISTASVGSSYASQTYDAFGRNLLTYALDHSISLRKVYHALSVDAWDAADLTPNSGHYGTFATTLSDGHGRTTAVTERVNSSAASQASYQTTTSYIATGQPQVITRTNIGSKATPVVRWMKYDTQGRMVANVEPDTSVGFKPSTGTSLTSGSLLAWLYAYNDSGDLVGTSDARGCGENFTYDGGGRIATEDYSPCTSTQPSYSATPEVTYSYDTQATGALDFVPTADSIRRTSGTLSALAPALPPPTPPPAAAVTWYRGRLSGTTDRSGETIPVYDARGNTVTVARQLATPSGGTAPTWYWQNNVLDADDRVVAENTFDGVPCAGCDGVAPQVSSATTFSKRSLIASINSSNGLVIASVTHDADKKPLQIVYGDAAGTTSVMSYDMRRRLSSVQTYRGPPAIWSAPPATYVPPPAYGGTSAPTTFQLLLQDLDYKYDVVDDPTEIDDFRVPTEWPSGAQPVSRTMQYDDLYRLTQLAYKYPSGSDSWTSPFAAEDNGEDDPQRATPVPQSSFAKRPSAQTFAYDWLGNTATTTDDAAGFYDRSLGTITNGTAALGPYQLQSASQVVASGQTAGALGSLAVAYDAAGNMTGLSVTRVGTCLPAGAVCSQRYAYFWDEVGRLAEAKRWDLVTPGAPTSALPTTVAAADLVYTYDATDDRAIKQATDGSGNVRYTLYPLDALEVRQTTWDEAIGDYDVTPATEDPYVFAQGVRLGRLALEETSDPALASGVTHMFLELPDYLGSTSVVIDHDTSELVEAATYQAYGATESDYRPARWNSFREDYRFTGKEEDVQVGLQYFGKRYLAPRLGRWVSADPLGVHVLGQADTNVYAYVHGRLLRNTDAVGLQDSGGSGAAEISDHVGPPSASAVIAHQAYVVLTNVEASAASAATYLAMRLFGATLKTEADVLPIITRASDVAGSFGLARAHAQESMPAPAEKIEASPPPSDEPPPFISGSTPLKEFDQDVYGSFNTAARKNDGLDGHEVLQNAWLKANGYIAGRGKGDVSYNNPAVALSEDTHKAVTQEQRKLGLLDPSNLANMSAEENIQLNAQAMTNAGVPPEVVQTASQEASSYANELSAPSK